MNEDVKSEDHSDNRDITSMKRFRDHTDVSEALSPMKRLKITSQTDNQKDTMESPSKQTRSRKGHHFFTACQQVLTDEFHDMRTRLELKYVPTCVWENNICNIHEKNPLQILSYEQEAFKIDVKSGMWTEALDVFKSVTKYNKFPTPDMMNDLIHMILSAVDERQIFTDSFIIEKCQTIFNIIFETHPPCFEEVRLFYKEFLLSSLKNYEKCVYYQEILSANENLTKCIISMLDKNINDLKNTKSNENGSEYSERITEDFFKFSNSIDNFVVFEKFDKETRTKRLFIILELIVQLLEKDLAIWIRKHSNNSSKYIVRPQKPLIVWILWQNRLHCGMVNNFCRDIFKFTKDLINFHYSPIYVDLGIRLINILFHTFYLSGNNMSSEYPEIGKNCSLFVNEFYNFVKSESLPFIFKLITLLKPKALRCLMAVNVVQNLLKSSENNFAILANSIFKACLWNRFKISNKLDVEQLILPKVSYVRNFLHNNEGKTYRKLKYLIDHILSTQQNTSKSQLNDVNFDSIEPSNAHFINAFYLALYYYFDMYCIEKIMLRHDDLCSDKSLTEIYNANKLLPLSTECLKQYRLIIKSKKDMQECLETVQNEYPTIFKLFKRIPLFQYE